MLRVFDIFRLSGRTYFTLGDLWHTRQVFARGEHWYDTGYDRIPDGRPPQDRRLLIVFPSTARHGGRRDRIKRHYQDNGSSTSPGQHFELGETRAFATVLFRTAPRKIPGMLGARVRRRRRTARGATGVVIRSGDREILVGLRTPAPDMGPGLPASPYTYDAGRIKVGPRNGRDLIFASGRGDGSITPSFNLTGALRRPSWSRRGDGITAWVMTPAGPRRAGKMRYWREKSAAR